MVIQPPNFDYIARPYRWLEHLTLGRALERCRLHFLPHLANRSNALVLGDGDGRFLAALLQHNPTLTADAVDSSAAMLKLLGDRCRQTTPDTELRLRTHHAEALSFLAAPSSVRYDLVVTHFFLDCLSQNEVDTLAAAVAARVSPGAVWIVSDFRIPAGPMRAPARLLVRSLYLAFRMLTGLSVTRLPDHAAALVDSGFVLSEYTHSLAGILTTERWTRA